MLISLSHKVGGMKHNDQIVVLAVKDTQGMCWAREYVRTVILEIALTNKQ
jgi:hypothetical protein